MMREDIADNFKHYADNGGCLILTGRSGIKSWSNVTIDTPWPGLFAELAGVLVQEFEVLPDQLTNTIAWDGTDYEV
jgi:beta-galactosidase